jgi:two-component system OmpR family response regulator
MAKVLVVEDDPTMGALLERGLGEEGYDVVLVTTGMDALIAAANTDFAAAAIDVMLPEMTGFEICRHLRARGSTLPVLLLTARDAVEDRVFGLDSGADDYLTKPFAFVELSARLRALVRRDASAPKPTIHAGRILLDTQAVRATVDGKQLPLSTKEFSLLRLLAARAGTAISRTDILEDVWGTSKHIDPTIVDQYISYLRRKLDSVAPVGAARVPSGDASAGDASAGGESTSGAGFSIVTVRGIGYALVVDGSGE